MLVVRVVLARVLVGPVLVARVLVVRLVGVVLGLRGPALVGVGRRAGPVGRRARRGVRMVGGGRDSGMAGRWLCRSRRTLSTTYRRKILGTPAPWILGPGRGRRIGGSRPPVSGGLRRRRWLLSRRERLRLRRLRTCR
ncbi:hypothetical protein GCM10009742_19850 [Kribbella karoonensis]|uniref:Secreted protein n=1 Tax=Kribbella karoonensis TaxID=324851 RepID=A0ABN2DF16_9ACTN